MKGIFNFSQWPWIDDGQKFPALPKAWPKISVIVPSFNQGAYMEETLLSVIRQNYPELELIVIDGGSTDHTVEILKKYESKIHYWVSEKDKGQSHAINKGMEKANGEWIAWLNSDDCYLKDAFYHLFHEIKIDSYDFIYGNYRIGRSLEESREVKVIEKHHLSFSKVIRFFYGIDYIIPSQSVFVRRSLMEKVGSANEDLHYCMDVDWYARIFRLGPRFHKYKKTLCFFRVNETTKTGGFSHIDFEENKMGKEAEALALKYSKDLNWIEKIKFDRLYDYYRMYSREPQKYEQSGWYYLCKLILNHPVKALTDRRVLGMIKRKFMKA